MRKKMIIAVCMGILLVAAALLYIRLMGGGGAGIDNEPEADVRGDSNVLESETKPAQNEGKTAGGSMANGNVANLSGIVPDELEYIPSEYASPSEHPGTLEKQCFLSKSRRVEQRDKHHGNGPESAPL